MSVPSLATTPTLSTWQMSYGGLNFAGVEHGATYQLEEMPEGIDIPEYMTGDVQRALDAGEFPGLDVMAGRDVVIKQIIGANTARALDEARQNFAGVLAPAGVVEAPLYLQLASGLYCCMARPRKHKFSVGISDVYAHASLSTTLWHATDPRWYASPSTQVSCGLPESSGGLVLPATWPLTIAGSEPNSVAVNNTGKMEMRPIVSFTGPFKGPKVTNSSLPGAPSIGFNLSLNAGDVLTVDLNWQSAVLVTSGSTQGSSRRSSEKPGSVWFNCPPKSETFSGVSVLTLSSEDTSNVGGIMSVLYAPAYPGL